MTQLQVLICTFGPDGIPEQNQGTVGKPQSRLLSRHRPPAADKRRRRGIYAGAITDSD